MKVLLGITGSVGAVLTSKLIAKLQANGHEVKAGTNNLFGGYEALTERVSVIYNF